MRDWYAVCVPSTAPASTRYNVSSIVAIGGGGAPTPPQMIALAQRLVPTAVPNQVRCAVLLTVLDRSTWRPWCEVLQLCDPVYCFMVHRATDLRKPTACTVPLPRVLRCALM